MRFGELANLAHELRTPVQVLLGYTDILREDLQDDIGPRARAMIDRLTANVHDLARTAENLLDFAYESASAELELEEEFELQDLLAEIAPELDSLNLRHKLELTFDLSRAPARIRTRRKPLRSIVANLAVNAVKFTNRGLVTIAVRGLPSPQDCQELEIAISDTGPGIDPARIDDAFTAGKQLSLTSARSYRGMGLGLAVVRRNLEAIGASLQVDTEPGSGSCFTLRVPLCRKIENGNGAAFHRNGNRRQP